MTDNPKSRQVPDPHGWLCALERPQPRASQDVIARTKTGWGASRANYATPNSWPSATIQPRSSQTRRWHGDRERPKDARRLASSIPADGRACRRVNHPKFATLAFLTVAWGERGLVEIKRPNTAHVRNAARQAVPSKSSPTDAMADGVRRARMVRLRRSMIRVYRIQSCPSGVRRDDDMIAMLEQPDEVATFLREVDDTVGNLRDLRPG